MRANLLTRPRRQPAQPVIRVGAGPGREHDSVYASLRDLEITVARAEAASGTLAFDIRRGSDGRWSVLDEGIFTRWQRIRVAAAFGEDDQDTIVDGYVLAAKGSFPPSAGESTLQVEIQDLTAVLNRDHARTVHGADAPISDRQLVQRLLGGSAIRLDPQSHPGQQGPSRAQDKTAIQFIRERAEANGYELLLEVDSLYFGPPRLTGDVQPTIVVQGGTSTHCLNLDIEEDAQKPDGVRFDRAAEEGAAPDSETLRPDQPALGRTRAGAEGAELGDHIWRVSRDGDAPAPEQAARARALANQNEMKIRATGELDGSLYGHVLRPGRMVRVDGVGPRHTGLYYVDTVTHRFTGAGYRQSFELVRNATGDLEADGASGLSVSVRDLF
jgi:hypothetical protein